MSMVAATVTGKVGRDYPPPIDLDLDLGSLDESAYRHIKYDFSEDVLRLPSIQVAPCLKSYTPPHVLLFVSCTLGTALPSLLTCNGCELRRVVSVVSSTFGIAVPSILRIDDTWCLVCMIPVVSSSFGFALRNLFTIVDTRPALSLLCPARLALHCLTSSR